MCFSFSGCDEKVPPEPKLSFSADIYVSVEDGEDESFLLEAELSVAPEGLVQITVSSPDELWGLSFSYAENFEMSYNGLHVQTEKGYLPSGSFAEVIYNVLASLRDNANCESFSEGVAEFEGECKSGDYEVLTDKDGNIIQISAEDIKIEFRYNTE
ncbi:MAG: hypothetical protein ACI4GZ_00475 [Ruminococcus sp.]